MQTENVRYANISFALDKCELTLHTEHDMTSTTSRQDFIATVVREFGERAGSRGNGESALAKACGVSRITVRNWKKKNSVSAAYAEKVAELTGVPAYRLNAELRQGVAAIASNLGLV